MMVSKEMIGSVVTFSYVGKYATEPYPRVFILHNSWPGPHNSSINYVHGLSLNVLTETEINYIKGLINPELAYQLAKKNSLLRMSFASVGILGHGGESFVTKFPSVKSPHDFYIRFIKNFIKAHDSYRLYIPLNVKNLKVLSKYQDFAKVVQYNKVVPPKQSLTKKPSMWSDYLRRVSK